MIVALLTVGLGLYVPSVDAPYFHFDDKITIADKFNDKNILNIPGIWTAFNTRFLVGLTFALNYVLGGLDPFSYRLVNVVIHSLTAVVVFRFCRLFFKTPALAKQYSSDVGWHVSALAGLIFAVHPIQTEAVNFITQRFVLLASLFYLSTLTLYLKARISHKKEYLLGALLTTWAAMFCKEFTVTLPLMVLLLEVMLFGQCKDSRSRRFLYVLPFLLSLVIIPLTLLKTDYSTLGTAKIADLHVTFEKDSYQQLDQQVDITRAAGWPHSRMEYFLTELNVLRTYLRLLFVPLRQNIDYDYPVSHSLFEPGTFFSAILLLAILVTAIAVYRRFPVLSFCILWFFLVLSVESSIIPIGHVIAEYRLYLASVSMALMTALVICFCVRNPRQKIWISVVLILALGLLTWQRNTIWRNEELLWQDTVRKSPRKPRPYANLGAVLANRKDYDQAKEFFQKAVALDPQFSRGYISISYLYTHQLDYRSALPYALRAYEIVPVDKDYIHQLAYLYFHLNQWDQCSVFFQKLIALEPQESHALDYSKVIIKSYLADGNKERALQKIAVLEQYHFDALAETVRAVIDGDGKNFLK